MNSAESSVTGLVRIALCTAVTCILAPLSLPVTGSVPVSLSTFAVMLSGAVLGSRGGALSQLLYLLLGCAGLPVFAGWTAGPGRLLGLTGGYLLAYIPMAFVIGLLLERFGAKAQDVRFLFLSLLCGEIVLYVIGTAWFMAQSGMTLTASLMACVIPFIPGDLVKMAAVCAVAPQVLKASRRFAEY